MSKHGQTQKHHWTPEFYLKQWATSEKGELTVYERDKYQGVVKPFKRHPKNVGFRRGLYALEHLEEKDRNIVEQELFTKNVDTPAAPILRQLIAGIDENEFTENEKIKWTSFLIALYVRRPKFVDDLKADGEKIFAEAIAAEPEEYEKILPGVDILDFIEKNTKGGVKGMAHEIGLKSTLPNLIGTSQWRDEIIKMD